MIVFSFFSRNKTLSGYDHRDSAMNLSLDTVSEITLDHSLTRLIKEEMNKAIKELIK